MRSPGSWWAAALLFLQASALAEVQLGNETLAADRYQILQGKRIALLTNPSGINRKLQTTLESLRAAPGVNLVALFGPEHGLYGVVPAGQEFTNNRDPHGLPIYSLYGPGPVRKPTPAMLKGLDALVYDIQDTGCRSYTFVSTMGLAMEACAEAGVEFIVLDRPNPLGGERVEGPSLDPRYRSLVGEWNVPYVYGLTCGELARMINGEGWIRRPCHLTVVPLRGWRRAMTWRDTGLPWIRPSPYMPNGDSPLHYVSTGILGEIGGVNIGIGADRPFECIAAPWLDAKRTSQFFNDLRLPGINFAPTTYRPATGIFNGKTVQGVRVEFTDPAHAPLMAINFYALEGIKKLAGRDLFAETERNSEPFCRPGNIFDKINGSDVIRKQLRAGQSAAAIVRSWRPDETAFRLLRQKYLLY